jgi:hypothetical protein
MDHQGLSSRDARPQSAEQPCRIQTASKLIACIPRLRTRMPILCCQCRDFYGSGLFPFARSSRRAPDRGVTRRRAIRCAIAGHISDRSVLWLPISRCSLAWCHSCLSPCVPVCRPLPRFHRTGAEQDMYTSELALSLSSQTRSCVQTLNPTREPIPLTLPPSSAPPCCRRRRQVHLSVGAFPKPAASGDAGGER